MVFGRDNLSKAAKDVLDHLQMVDNIKALQIAQKELADAVAKLDDRLKRIEIEFGAVRAEIRSDVLGETLDIVTSVQGGLNQRIQDIAVNIAVLQHDRKNKRPDGASPSLQAPPDRPAESTLKGLTKKS